MLDRPLDTAAEKKAWQRYLDDRKRWVATGPTADPAEADAVKAARIARLKGSFSDFCWYYFSKYQTDEESGQRIPLGWFHKKAAKDIIADRNFFGVLEWPREHAKSVFADIFLVLYLKAIGQVSGCVIVSNNQTKAMGLLADVQAELEANVRYIADFGEQRTYGDWEEQNFTTQDGTGFWALGRGQSPRGLRKAEKRPNMVIVDDFDDEEFVENEARVQKGVDWLLGGLYGAIATKGARFIMVGNRIHQKSALAHVVGDVEKGQVKKDGVYHLKVFALENPKTHAENQGPTGVPAWRENYSLAQIRLKMDRMGVKIAQRELFHKHIRKGLKFKSEWLTWVTVGNLSAYPFVVTYVDPSYKDSNTNDFKAIVAVAPIGHFRDLVDCWIRQTSKSAMVNAHYDMVERLMARGARAVYNYIEGKFIQPEFLKTYYEVGEQRGYQLSIHLDNRMKPDKRGRIEDLQPNVENGATRFAQDLATSVDYREFEDQLLQFPSGHDDGPDALEGGIWICNQKASLGANPVTMGGQRRTNKRSY